MKKYLAIILTIVFIFTIAIAGCEKKTEAPKAAEPVVAPTPVAPAPEPVAVPAPPAPDPVPAKPAKK